MKALLMTLSMIAVGLLTWRALQRQGFGSPPTDDPAEPGVPADGTTPPDSARHP